LQMSELSKLAGKAKKYKIGDIELLLSPRKLEDIDLLFALGEENSNEARSKALKELISRTLKEAFPDATDEEIANIGFQHFKELADAIIDVNGLKNDTAISD